MAESENDEDLDDLDLAVTTYKFSMPLWYIDPSHVQVHDPRKLSNWKMTLANKCRQLERCLSLLHEQCPVLAIAILQLQASRPTR
jgi:hypothetical protein